MKTKKKVLVAALAVALLAIMVGGSLAYFTDNDEVTNTFTIGSVLIDIWENNTPTDSDVMEFDTPLVPVVNTTDVSADDGFADKVVKVENTGVSSAYVRTHIAVPTALIGYLELKLDLSAWTYVGTTTATVEGVDYTVFTYDYNSALAADAFTEDLLLGAYLKADVDLKDNPATPSADLEICKKEANGTYTFSGYVAHEKTNAGYEATTLNILVASEAIQSQGFTAGATDALNSGFGANTNPWA
jgi:predicted ribosomally synthesized peptide with SipW-like signal peptide